MAIMDTSISVPGKRVVRIARLCQSAPEPHHIEAGDNAEILAPRPMPAAILNAMNRQALTRMVLHRIAPRRAVSTLGCWIGVLGPCGLFGCGGSAEPSSESRLPVTPPAFPAESRAQADAGAARLTNVLVFSRTTGYRHESIGAGLSALRGLGEANGFTVKQTEDAGMFSDAALDPYQVVIWLNTTLDVLNEAEQAAFERYLQRGRGWVGIHAAADTEYEWPWYGGLLGGGAWFAGHPAIQPAQVVVEVADHPSTVGWLERSERIDEWYSFKANPRAEVSVLLTLDESSYQVGEFAMGADHPISWCHEYQGGRAWYTGLGHRTETYSDPLFLEHVLGGIRWAAGSAP
jgi:type 1 glutamine amidotransferase